MSNYTATGKILSIADTRAISEKFSLREFVVEIADDKYPQTVAFQCSGKRTCELDGVKVGDKVEISFNLRGREWTSPKTGETKVFNTLDCWLLKVLDKAGEAPTSAAPSDEIPF